MSARLEQSAEELGFLVGATVTGVKVVDDEIDYGFESIEVTFDLAQPTVVEGNLAHSVGVQIWQDPEGNGPGFAAVMWTRGPA